jgi:hypothetical protein
MSGCDSCAKNLKSEIGSKDESEMTEQEKAVLAGEQEAPWAYGPLSSWDGDYCEFCHGIGQIGAAFFGFIVWFIVQDLFSSGAGVLAGVIIWIGLAIVVGYVGRFPVLGALFGPMVEKILALQFDIYVTEKARQDYGPGVRADGGRSGEEEVINDFPIKGAEMHLVAAPWALETCADLEPEVLMRVEVENGAIVDKHNFHPEFNRFRNLKDHVGYFNPNITNVCEAEAQSQGPTTLIQFSEVVQSQGQGGIE